MEWRPLQPAPSRDADAPIRIHASLGSGDTITPCGGAVYRPRNPGKNRGRMDRSRGGVGLGNLILLSEFCYTHVLNMCTA